MTTLLELLKMAHVSPGQREGFFDSCWLDGNVIMCPERAQAERVARLFGNQIREIIPTVAIRVAVAAPKAPDAKPRKTKPKSDVPGYLNAAGQKWFKAEQRKLTESE